MSNKIESQLKTSNQHQLDSAKQIEKLANKCKDLEKSFDKKLEILEPFKDSINQNYACIEIAERNVNEMQKSLEKFQNDDMFINSRNNYYELYRSLMD